MKEFDRSVYRDKSGVVHVVEAKVAGEWQFSNGPPEQRGCSTDYTDLNEGLRDFAGETLMFHYDEPAAAPLEAEAEINSAPETGEDAALSRARDEVYDEIEVRVIARLSASLTLALRHDGLSADDVAENLAHLLGADKATVGTCFDGFEIYQIGHEGESALIENFARSQR